MKKFVSALLLLLAVAAPSGVAQTAGTLLLIDGRPVAVTEYKAYCRLCHILEHDTAVSLNNFVDFKLKAAEASDMRCDTLTSFRSMLDALTAEVGRKEQDHTWNGLNVQRGGWVKVEMLTVPVRQDASNAQLEQSKHKLETLYRKLQTDGHLRLSQLSAGRLYHAGGQWLPVDWMLPEEAAAVRRTDVGEYSDVFVSSVGVNLLRVIDRTDNYSRTVEPAATASYPLKDILLALYWDNLLAQQVNQEDIDERTLAEFFLQNREHYAFDLPHYKGVTVFCADRRSMKTIKRKMKRTPYDRWPGQIERMVRERRIGMAKAEYGLFRIGTNDVVDCLAFKCIPLPENKDFPYIFIEGRILKKAPECLDDVRDKVVRDYRAEQENMQLHRLRERHHVEYLVRHP